MKTLKNFKWQVISFILLFATCFPVAQADLIGGDPKGAITLVEFFDYTCPHCQKMHTVVEQLIKANPQLRVVYRPIPVLSQQSVFPALSVLAADYQHKALILNQALLNSGKRLNQPNVLAIAEANGINRAQLMRDMQKPAVAETLQENLNLAKKLGIQHLPTFILGRSGANQPDQVFYGEIAFAQLQVNISRLKHND